MIHRKNTCHDLGISGTVWRTCASVARKKVDVSEEFPLEFLFYVHTLGKFRGSGAVLQLLVVCETLFVG